MSTPASTAPAGGPMSPGLDLYWIPLGAGAQVVRYSGKTYEAISAWIRRRPRRDLYHSALVAVTAGGRFVIEMTPIPAAGGTQDRGVAGEGPVASRWLGRFRVFRYEVRRWREGVIPDLCYAVASPVRLTGDAAIVGEVVDLVPRVPTPVWGRDELHLGEMWNSNSVIAWLLASAGLELAAGQPPGGGSAPGWRAGLLAARRARDGASIRDLAPRGS